MVARQLTAATHFPGQLSCKASGHGRAMLAPTRVFASLGPKYSCPPHGSLSHRLRAEPPRRGGQERAVPRAEFSPFVGNVIRRGAFYMRPRKFALPQAGTGGYGIRPYVFLWRPPAQRRPRGAFLPVVRASGFISAFALSKTTSCGILFLYKSTGKPGANRRRKAIGAHRVSQLPTRNCCFTAAGSFASFWGQELTRVKTQRYTGGTKQGIYNALLFFAARGYCLIRSDSAFRYGSAMP